MSTQTITDDMPMTIESNGQLKHKLRNIKYNFPIIAVLILTLLLLTYIGYGEANRKYPVFELEKLATQAEIIQHSFDSYLQAGLPLKQFSGFKNQSDALLQSDPSIEKIIIVDPDFNIIFFNYQRNQIHEKNPDSEKDSFLKKLTNNIDEVFSLAQLDMALGNESFHSSDIMIEESGKKITESDSRYRITVALDNKFGLAGYVILDADQKTIFNFLQQEFKVVFYWLIALSLGFIVFILIRELFFPDQKNRKATLKWVYLLCFITMSAVIAVNVFQIYEHGARANTKALSNSMAQRLNAILDLGIEFDDIEGINTTFKTYKKNNPDINAIALTRQNISVFHTNESMIGHSYHVPDNSIDYVNILNGNNTTQEFRVAVSIPTDVIMDAIMGSAKTFVVLLIACSLISIVFVDACTALMAVKNDDNQELEQKSDENSNFQVGLSLIRPAYFLIIFVNALSLSFLPQLIDQFAQKSEISWASASLPFTLFYLFFAAVLIPAGNYAERGDLKKLMAAGFIAEVIGLTMVALTAYSITDLFSILNISSEYGFSIKDPVFDYWLLILGRSSSGIGQGLFLIGLQSYILSVTPKDKRTQGAAVKVIGRNAGLIAGTAIGALLYSYMDYNGIFILASILSLIAMAYLWRLVPDVESIMSPSALAKAKTHAAKTSSIWANTIICFKDSEFMKTLILVGLIGKIAISGVFMFGVPLLLAKKGFSTEDIGQFLMIYYISSMVVTQRSARLIDAIGKTKSVLMGSSLIGGFSIALLGIIGISEWSTEGLRIPGIEYLAYWIISFNQMINAWGIANIQTYFILFCLLLAGTSNGLLAAPVLTHINKTDVAHRMGNKSITATYIFLERAGHVIGPLFISYILLMANQSTLALSFFGVIMVLLGIIFQVTAKKA